MPKQTTSNLYERAQGVRGELVEGANTATRIGQLLLDILASTALEFDANRPYAPGEYIIWQGRNVRCLTPTLAGDSPATHAAKWDDPVIDSVEKLGPNGNNYSVLASALKGYVTNRINANNGTGGGGAGARKATTDDMNEGINDTDFVTPYLVNLVVDKILDALDQNDVPTLDAVAKAGDLAGRGKTTQLLKLLGGLFLGNIPATADTTFTELVLDSAGKVWQRGGTVVIPPNAVITHRFRQIEQYDFVEDVAPPPANVQTARVDYNDCQHIQGWVQGGSARIERDGVVVVNVTPTIPRPDVATYLLNQYGITVSSNVLGFEYFKTNETGTHDWRVFIGTSNIEATTDLGAPITLQCSLPSNPKPTLNNPQPDITRYANGVYTTVLPIDEFLDNAGDPGTKRIWHYDGGTMALGPLPSFLSFDGDRTLTEIITDSVPSQGFVLAVQYADSANQAAPLDLILYQVIKSVVTPPHIDRMSIYTPQGWHDATGGNVSENLVLLVNVASGTSATPVQACYPGSRNDATFGAMQPIDYSNNPAPNTLPPGYTHYTQFNDEVFTGSLKSFQARLTNVSNSTVQASYLSAVSIPDHTTTQIYPVNN